MSNFFDKLGQKAGDFFNKAAETAGDLTQTAKFKMEISKYTGQIKDLQNALGKDIVEARLNGETIESLSAPVDECVEKIKNIKLEIQRVEEEIVKLKEEPSNDSCCNSECECKDEDCECTCEEDDCCCSNHDEEHCCCSDEKSESSCQSEKHE